MLKNESMEALGEATKKSDLRRRLEKAKSKLDKAAYKRQDECNKGTHTKTARARKAQANANAT